MRDTEQKVQEARRAARSQCCGGCDAECYNGMGNDAELDALIAAVRADERERCKQAVRAIPPDMLRNSSDTDSAIDLLGDRNA